MAVNRLSPGCCCTDLPECDGCCDQDTVPEQVTIDFGVGGLTDAWCGSYYYGGDAACAAVTGEIILDRKARCSWEYVETFDCPRPCENTGILPASADNTLTLRITSWIEKYDADECIWVVEVKLSYPMGQGCTLCQDNTTPAYYLVEVEGASAGAFCTAERAACLNSSITAPSFTDYGETCISDIGTADCSTDIGAPIAQVALTFESGTYFLNVYWGSSSSAIGFIAWFRVSLGTSEPDCDSWSRLELSLYKTRTFKGNPWVDPFASVCFPDPDLRKAYVSSVCADEYGGYYKGRWESAPWVFPDDCTTILPLDLTKVSEEFGDDPAASPECCGEPLCEGTLPETITVDIPTP